MLIEYETMIQGAPIDCMRAVIASGLESSRTNPLTPEIVVNRRAALIMVQDRKDPVTLVNLLAKKTAPA